MKSTKSTEQPTMVKPKFGAETLVGIAKIVLDYRGTTKPNLAEIVRIIGRASGLLKIADEGERSETENKAVLLLAKELGLVA
jgi:hypothetical protein